MLWLEPLVGVMIYDPVAVKVEPWAHSRSRETDVNWLVRTQVAHCGAGCRFAAKTAKKVQTVHRFAAYLATTTWRRPGATTPPSPISSRAPAYSAAARAVGPASGNIPIARL